MVGSFTGLCPGKLGLSNTLVPRKTLSSSKPPQLGSSFAAFQHVLDGTGLPGKGRGGTLQGSFIPCSARFRTFPSKEACTGPKRSGSYPTEPEGSGSFPLNPLGPEALSRQDPAPSLFPAGSGSFPLSR